jgi:hypothetical protein
LNDNITRDHIKEVLGKLGLFNFGHINQKITMLVIFQSQSGRSGAFFLLVQKPAGMELKPEVALAIIMMETKIVLEKLPNITIV